MTSRGLLLDEAVKSELRAELQKVVEKYAARLAKQRTTLDINSLAAPVREACVVAASNALRDMSDDELESLAVSPTLIFKNKEEFKKKIVSIITTILEKGGLVNVLSGLLKEGELVGLRACMATDLRGKHLTHLPGICHPRAPLGKPHPLSPLS